jgi:hypothetical protein
VLLARGGRRHGRHALELLERKLVRLQAHTQERSLRWSKHIQRVSSHHPYYQAGLSVLWLVHRGHHASASRNAIDVLLTDTERPMDWARPAAWWCGSPRTDLVAVAVAVVGGREDGDDGGEEVPHRGGGRAHGAGREERAGAVHGIKVTPIPLLLHLAPRASDELMMMMMMMMMMMTTKDLDHISYSLM